jgi:predicted O-linked N-acetylglucosamine transferase (SPINDLY family)
MRAGRITFGSVNTLMKLNEQVIATWSNILRQTASASSRLILQAFGLNDAATRQLVLDAFARHGIEAARLELVGFAGFIDFLRLFQRIDIALDPFPFNGGTTTFHTLWMGVPVITLSGQLGVSRMGRSVLTNLGLSELIAATPQEYADIAAMLAGDVNRMAELRRTMRDRMLASPLMRAVPFTRHLESLYASISRRAPA